MKYKDSFKQVGWWVPGSLQTGWQKNLQANINDMSNKLSQLHLSPLVSGQAPNENIGFFFSQAEFDFIQLLSYSPNNTPDKNQPASAMVTYSVWLASQGWAHFSPIPILEYKSAKIKTHKLETGSSEFYLNYPLGWYFTGSFSVKWFYHLDKNYETVYKKLRELDILPLSPLYLTQSTLYQFVQMVQLPITGDKPVDQNIISEFIAWFTAQGFGEINAIPFMSQDLLTQAVQNAGKTP